MNFSLTKMILQYIDKKTGLNNKKNGFITIVYITPGDRPSMDSCKTALPPSDLHGWRKCNRNAGTILAITVVA